jgi:hypothetical protein
MVLVAALLLVARNLVGHSIVSIAAQSVTAGIIYAAVFVLFAISKEDRQWYIAKIKQLTRRRPRVAVTAYQSGD